ncbi:MFS transporter [Streptomyces sp. AcE210]|uniref:MFS transporter n=1 Tax=Streptomyces sp. AcE210 TaxID=2292703 RepID=UPI000E2FFFB5|nr:MFS transporter [Streptomyces sp. AcE210]RFC71514.1 MFS transporter [Streptomyces sp. AcE210]
MTTAETSPAPTGSDHVPQKSSDGLKIAALATGFVMATLDVTIVNVAGATLQEKLGASLTQLTWIVDGYILTFASLLMLAGGLANWVGAKTVYMWGMGLFLVASLGCAFAPTPEVLIAARLLQGAGAALFMPSSLSLLVNSFPEKRRRTRMLGLWSAIVAASSGVGPTLGGVMVSAFGWQSIFLLNLPIGIVGMLMTQRYVAAPEGHTTRLAATGHVIWIVALAAVSYALIEGPQLGWGAAPVVVAYAVAVLAAVLLVARERRSDNLVMPWSLFRSAGFAGANLVGFFFNFALFGSIFMLGLFFQHAQGASPFVSGLELIPITILSPLANVVYSKISGRFSNGPLLTVFLTVAGVASLTMVTVTASTPYWVIAVAIGIANIGAGIISPGMTAALVDAAGPQNANVAGSVLNANRQIGSLVGIAAIGVVLQMTSDWSQGASVSFLLVGVSYLLGAVCAWRLVMRSEQREDAVASPSAARA